MVKDCQSMASDNIFDCILQVASFLNINENFPLYITKQLFNNFLNFHKLVSRKLKHYKTLNKFLESEKEADLLSETFSVSIISKTGPKSKRKSFDNLNKSAKYKKLNNMAQSNSPSSNLNFSLHTLSKLPTQQLSTKIDFLPAFNGLSEIDCITLMSFLDLSVAKYEYLCQFLVKRNMPSLFSYRTLYEYKKINLYTDTFFSENSAISTFSGVLVKTLEGIVNFSKLDSNEPIEIAIKYGADGSDYKMAKTDVLTNDNSVFVVCFCILKIKQGRIILFENPSPSSTLYCRPLRMYFLKETPDLIKSVFTEIKTELESLKSFKFTFSGKQFDFKGTFYPSMVDGKVVNAIFDNTNTKLCFICGEKGNSLNTISPSTSAYKDVEIFKFGLQPLHILIRVTEWVLKISYSLENTGNRVSDKIIYEQRKKAIHNKIKEIFSINIDVPSIKNGRTTDGNMARKVFSNHQVFANCLELDPTFIRNISCLLACVSSSRKVDPEKYKNMASNVFQFYSNTYSKYVNITPTVHKFLCHVHQFLNNLAFSSGTLSEQVIEQSHKFTKKYKKLSFSNKRKNILRDIYNRFYILSSPKLSREYHEMKKNTYSFIPENEFQDMFE